MSQHKDPLLEALIEGKSYTWTAPDGGDFASMRKAIKHGQTLTMSPVENPADVQVGDIVFVKIAAPIPNRIRYLIDCGKLCVGLAGEIFALFEYDELDWFNR
jgi:hypothetical protein